MFEAKVIEHSIAPHGGLLLTTQLKYPRYIHAELMTHRVFSRNASSSRAIPVKKLVEASLAEMVTPIRWGLNQPGMQANEQNLSRADQEEAEMLWREAAEFCGQAAIRLSELGLHKQWANRMTEWFGHISVVVTATDWDNWYELRDHPDAQPEIRELARLMREAHRASVPVLRTGTREEAAAWHLPYVSLAERAQYREMPTMLAKLSTARCARTSYLNHDGTAPNPNKDLELFEMLVGSRPLHASPTEHQGYPLPLRDQTSKNFRGWRQHRELIEHLLFT